MGNELKPIILGGATVYNAVKTDVKYDSNDKPIYCVWLESGAYAEYPEQAERKYDSFFARDVDNGIISRLTQKAYESGVKEKDGKTYELTMFENCSPIISEALVEDSEWGKVYRQTIDGFQGVKFKGSEHSDKVYMYDVINSQVDVNNDECVDEVYNGIGTKNVDTKITKNKDIIYKFSGFAKGKGYINQYK